MKTHKTKMKTILFLDSTFEICLFHIFLISFEFKSTKDTAEYDRILAISKGIKTCNFYASKSEVKGTGLIIDKITIL